jgi:glycosyltransferase involved in cell wall biosynthesis
MRDPSEEPKPVQEMPIESGVDPQTRIRVLGIYWVPSFWSLGPRTGASSFFLSVQSYARFGHEIHVSIPRTSGQPAYEEDEGVRMYRYSGAINFESNPKRIAPIRITSRFLRYFYFLIIGTWNAVRLGRKIHPDLVVGYHYHGAPVGYLAGKALGVPNVTRLFGTQLNRILDHPLKMITAFMQVAALRTPASYIIMHNDGSEGDVVARRLGVPAERFRFWRDGTDYSLYQPEFDTSLVRRELGIPEDHVILFSVGRFEEDKRMGRLVEVLPDVLRQEPRVTLLLVGDGGDRPDIEADAAALGVTNHLRITGSIPRERLYKYFNLGDIFVGVSDRTNANLPPIEAMSCAKPIVALDSGGTRQLIEDGVTGILVDKLRWKEDLPGAIVSLLRDPTFRRRLGAQARERILREIPTLEERQRMEVEVGLLAVKEFRAVRAAAKTKKRRIRAG